MTTGWKQNYGVVTGGSGQLLKWIPDPMCCGHRIIGQLRDNYEYPEMLAGIKATIEFIRQDRQRCRVSVIIPVGQGMDDFAKAFTECKFRKSGKGTWNNSNTGHTLQSYILDIGQ